jgi:3alpha(or 20beta)-hydroxysteroid dehydrogenase
MARLAGRTAIITGAARGLGASLASLFHHEGANVVLADVRDDECTALAMSLGERAHAAHLDVADEGQWTRLIDDTRRWFGALHVLVNNAGVYRTKPLAETTADDYMHVIRINQLSCFLGMRSCAAAMRDSGGGSIVNIASTAGLEGVASALPYTASKHAVVGMTRAASLELAQHRIRVNAVCPEAWRRTLAESLNMSIDALIAMRHQEPDGPHGTRTRLRRGLHCCIGRIFVHDWCSLRRRRG